MEAGNEAPKRGTRAGLQVIREMRSLGVGEDGAPELEVLKTVREKVEELPTCLMEGT